MTSNAASTPSASLRAHERLSTGTWARWARFCATHPWRVIIGWVAILIVLVGLVITVGGSLRDEFEIPGSDTQRATDLIESKFASEQGGVLNIVFAAPAGQRLDTPERKAAIEKAIGLIQTAPYTPTADKAGIESAGDPFSPDTVSDDGRIAYAEAQFDQTIEDTDRDAGRRSGGHSSGTPSRRSASRSSSTAMPSSRRSSRGRRSYWGVLAAVIVLWSSSARSWR